MSKELSIEEVQYKKGQLTHEVFKLVQGFEKETSCRVTDINMSRATLGRWGGTNESVLVSVDLTVEL